MTVSWRQLALGGAAIALVGAAGYAYYKSTKVNEKCTPATDATNDKTVPKKKKKKAASAASISPPAPKKMSDEEMMQNMPPDIAKMFAECDRPLKELSELPIEQKQQIFYSLLMRGEMFMNMDRMELALDSFSKAVSLVPNPGEVVAALEKTLPVEVFNALLDRIQETIKDRVVDYFENLPPKDAPIKFVNDSIQTVTNFNGEVAQLPMWQAISKKDVSVGSKLWEEDADAASLLCTVPNPEDYCEHCLKPKGDSPVSCPACDLFLYCSESCRKKSEQCLHPFFCGAPLAVKQGIEKLLNHCVENDTSIPLFMLRYVAFLLSEELRGYSSNVEGPFAHYDHVTPAYTTAQEIDHTEAKILRQIFENTNQQVAEFLSAEIYATMKKTLLRVCFTLVPDGHTDSLSRIESRQVECDSDKVNSMAFFPVAAHLAHSCDPNCVVVCSDPRHIRVAAIKNITSNTPITVSFIPFREGIAATERRIHLLRLFGFECKCDLCEADLPMH